MGRRWRSWPLTGFLTAAVLGTLAHFTYRWSGGALLAGVFCAVNESVWEHMKLLFFPVFLFTAAQFCMGERDGLLAARAVSVTAGLALIPTLYYTYTGIWGDHVLWADAAIFYLSAAVTFWLDDLLHRQRRLWKMVPATGRLPPDGRTGRSFIEQRRLIADSKSGQCSATAGGTACNHRTYTSGVCPIRPAAGTSHRQMRKTSATLRLATGRGTGLL